MGVVNMQSSLFFVVVVEHEVFQRVFFGCWEDWEKEKKIIGIEEGEQASDSQTSIRIFFSSTCLNSKHPIRFLCSVFKLSKLNKISTSLINNCWNIIPLVINFVLDVH
jgi:hypothetical protein